MASKSSARAGSAMRRIETRPLSKVGLRNSPEKRVKTSTAVGALEGA